MPRPSGECAKPSRTSSWGGRPSIDLPSKRIAPPVGFRSPEIARRVVVLPAPLPPMSVTICPASTLSVTPLRA